MHTPISGGEKKASSDAKNTEQEIEKERERKRKRKRTGDMQFVQSLWKNVQSFVARYITRES